MIESIVGKAAYDLIKVAALAALKPRLGDSIKKPAREQAIGAYRAAMEEWLIELLETFDYLGLDEDEIKRFFAPYMTALPKFLDDEGQTESPSSSARLRIRVRVPMQLPNRMDRYHPPAPCPRVRHPCRRRVVRFH